MRSRDMIFVASIIFTWVKLLCFNAIWEKQLYCFDKNNKIQSLQALSDSWEVFPLKLYIPTTHRSQISCPALNPSSIKT